MKTIALIVIILTAVIAGITTITQDMPALIFIDALTINGKYPPKITFLLTWLMLMLPMVPLMLVYNMIVAAKNKLPENLKGLTGLMIKRRSALANAAFPFDVIVDGEKKAQVVNGKSVFIPLKPGKYMVKVKTGRKGSFDTPVELSTEGITTYEAMIKPAKSNQIFAQKEGYIELNKLDWN